MKHIEWVLVPVVQKLTSLFPCLPPAHSWHSACGHHASWGAEHHRDRQDVQGELWQEEHHRNGLFHCAGPQRFTGILAALWGSLVDIWILFPEFIWTFKTTWLVAHLNWPLFSTKHSQSVFIPQRRRIHPSVCVSVPYFSQDLMEFLNANGTECSVVLFFTAWCQFSASLAPHFNALPRVFPSMHFLALDASQHSRWMAITSCINVDPVPTLKGH